MIFIMIYPRGVRMNQHIKVNKCDMLFKMMNKCHMSNLKMHKHPFKISTCYLKAPNNVPNTANVANEIATANPSAETLK